MAQAEQPDQEVQLVAAAVVYACVVAETVEEVGARFGDGVGVGEAEALVPGGEVGLDCVEVGAEGVVAEARAACVLGRTFRHESFRRVEDGEESADYGVLRLAPDAGDAGVTHAVGQGEDEGGDKVV